jgi:hypothetical protein
VNEDKNEQVIEVEQLSVPEVLIRRAHPWYSTLHLAEIVILTNSFIILSVRWYQGNIVSPRVESLSQAINFFGRNVSIPRGNHSIGIDSPSSSIQ